MANSKRKGDAFEREVALDLNRTYAPESLSGPLKNRPFRRTPLSGGFRRSNPADLICPPWFPFFIECKHRKDIANASWLFNLLETGENNYLIKTWLEERPKALALQKELLLVFKKTMSLPLCLTTVQALTRMDPGLASGRTDKRDIAIRYRCQGTDLVIVTWEAFLRRLTEPTLAALETYLRLGDSSVSAPSSASPGLQATELELPTDAVRARYGLK